VEVEGSNVTESQDTEVTINYSSNATDKFLWFAQYQGYSDKRSYYCSDFDKADFAIGGLFEPKETGSVSSQNGYWSNVNYEIYIGGYAIASQPCSNMKLKNQVANP
jgi:hypothetical protein